MKLAIVFVFALIAMTAAKRSDDERSCICTKHSKPLCDNLGNDHGNECEFECARRRYAKRGQELYIVKKGFCHPTRDQMKYEAALERIEAERREAERLFIERRIAEDREAKKREAMEKPKQDPMWDTQEIPF